MHVKTEAGKAHEIKNTAIAFGVYGQGSKRLGDVAVTNKGLVFSSTKSKSDKDVTVKWDDFIDWMKSQLPSKAKAGKTVAAKSAKSATKTAKAVRSKTSAAKSRTKSAANGAGRSKTASRAKSAAARKPATRRAAASRSRMVSRAKH